MKLNRRDVFDLAMIACLIACAVTFVCVIVAFVLNAFGISEVNQVVFHSWLLAFIQWVVVCLMWSSRETEESQNSRFSRIESTLEEAGLTTKTNECLCVFCKPVEKDKDEENSESGGAKTA